MERRSRLVRLVLLPLLIALGFMVWTSSAPSSAEAATIVVNSRIDDPYDGACSVREAVETLLYWTDIGGCAHDGEFDGVTDEIVFAFATATACGSSTPGLCQSGAQPFTVTAFAGASLATAQTYDGATAPAIDTSFEPNFGLIINILNSLTLIPPDVRAGTLLEALYLIDQLIGPGFPINGATPPLSGFPGLGDSLSE